jgi:deazaflavin-dependent oxidoreductase (nitroreductase family)
MGLTDRPPGRLMGAALRAPTLLYRAHLGWLLGSRFLCIVHRGRRTGRVRRTVVEVVAFDRERQEALVAAGWGRGAQWYRNLEAAPALEVAIGRRRWRQPRQRFLGEDERAPALARYEEAHPRAAAELARVLGDSEARGDTLAEMAARLPMVAFSPADRA